MMTQSSKQRSYRSTPTRAGTTQPSTALFNKSGSSKNVPKPLPSVDHALPSPPPAVPIKKRHASLPRATTSTPNEKLRKSASTRSSGPVRSKTGGAQLSEPVKTSAADKNSARKAERSTSVPRGFKLSQVRERFQRPLAPRKDDDTPQAAKPSAVRSRASSRPAVASGKGGIFLDRKLNRSHSASAKKPIIVVLPSNASSRESSHQSRTSHSSRLTRLRKTSLKAASVDKLASQAVRSIDAFISHSQKVIRRQGSPNRSRAPSPRRARPTETKKLSLTPSRDSDTRRNEDVARQSRKHTRLDGSNHDDENVTERGRSTTRNPVKNSIKAEVTREPTSHSRAARDRNYAPKSTRAAMTTASLNKQLPARPTPSQEFNIPRESTGRGRLAVSPPMTRQESATSEYSIVIQPSMSPCGSPTYEKAQYGSATKHITDEDLPPRIRRIMLQARRLDKRHNRSATLTESQSGSSGLLHSSNDLDDDRVRSLLAHREGQSFFHDDVTLAIEALRNFDRTSYGGLDSIAI